MIVALAWHQGHLRSKSLNPFQYFAATYWIRRQRENLVKDINDTVEMYLLYDNPYRYADLFFDRDQIRLEETAGQEPMTIAGSAVEEVVEDIDEVDAYFDNLEEQRGLTGGEVFEYLADDEGWS